MNTNNTFSGSLTTFTGETRRYYLFGKKIYAKDKLEAISPQKNKITSFLKLNGSKLLRSSCLKSEKIQEIMSFESIQEELFRLKHEKLVITKNNKAKKAFDVFMDFLVYYSVISSLFYLAFIEESTENWSFDIFVWLMFFIDFCLCFFTEFTDKKGKKVKNLKLISKKYAKSWMIFDLISLIPFSLFNNPHLEYLCIQLRIFKLNRLYNRIDLPKFSELVSSIFYSTESKMKKYFKFQIIELLGLIKELVTMLFVTYILACIWWYYVNLAIKYYDVTPNFVDMFSFDGLNIRSKFIRNWYFIFTTMMTVGYGDFYATNKFEMGFAIILLIAGPTWFAFTMGKAIQIINRFQEIGGKTDKLGQLNIWLSNIENKVQIMPFQLKEKIHHHFFYYWKNDRLGPMAIVCDENSTNFTQSSHIYLKKLPFSIKSKLLEHLFCDLFYQFKVFFRSFEKIKYELALHLKPRIFAKNEIILKQGHDAFEIFFKIQGTFSVGINVANEYKEILRVNDSFIIGEYFSLKLIKSFAHFKAITHVCGYSIQTFVLKELIESNTQDLEIYLESTKEYYKHIEAKITNEILETTIKSEKRNLNQSLEFQKNSENESSQIEQDFSYVEKSKNVLGEFEKITQNLNRFKFTRRKMISKLKETLANHFFQNTV